MMDGLKRRIENLEVKVRQRHGQYVVPIYPGETDEEAMRLAGVPADADMVILIRRFSVSRLGEQGVEAAQPAA